MTETELREEAEKFLSENKLVTNPETFLNLVAGLLTRIHVAGKADGWREGMKIALEILDKEERVGVGDSDNIFM